MGTVSSSRPFSVFHSQVEICSSLPASSPIQKFLICKFVSHPSRNFKTPSPWAGISPFPHPMEICMILLHILIPCWLDVAYFDKSRGEISFGYSSPHTRSCPPNAKYVKGTERLLNALREESGNGRCQLARA